MAGAEAREAHCANWQSKGQPVEQRTDQKRGVLENCLKTTVSNSADSLSKLDSASEMFQWLPETSN